MKAPLDCRISQWYPYLLQRVLDLARCGCEGVFFTKQRILWSSTLVGFHGLPGVWGLLSSPVRSFISKMYQIVDLALPEVSAVSLIARFCFFCLMTTSCLGFDTFLDHTLSVPMNSYQMQMHDLDSTRPFISIIRHEIRKITIDRNWPWNCSLGSCPIASEAVTVEGLCKQWL